MGPYRKQTKEMYLHGLPLHPQHKEISLEYISNLGEPKWDKRKSSRFEYRGR